MLNDITYTEADAQSTVPHLIEQFLWNSPKITIQLFFKSPHVNESGGTGCFILK